MHISSQYSVPKERLCRLLLLAGSLLLSADAYPWALQQESGVATGSTAFRVIEKKVSGKRKARLRILLADPAQTRLVILDNPENKEYLGHLMKKNGCLAGVNGGFFHPDTRPLGLMVSEGQTIHRLVRARLLSGVLAVKDRRLSLLRVQEFSPSDAPSQALQSGPFLIDQRKPVAGLNHTKYARRTVVLSGSSGQFGLLVSDSSFTLAELATLLAVPEIVHELDIIRALNLDGGSSSALWARTAEGTLYLPESKRVRNYLCLLAAD